MTTDRRGRGIETTTAIMLGLVSVITALGAWQASAWDTLAGEYEDDSNDALNVSINQSVVADYTRRIDQEASAEAVRYDTLKAAASEQDILFYDLRIATELGRTTEGFSDAWQLWQQSGFDKKFNPFEDADYVIASQKHADAYAYASRLLEDASKTQQAKSGVLAQAALIQALALFLFGISGVNRLRSVRIGVLVLGMTVFLAGFALAVTAF